MKGLLLSSYGYTATCHKHAGWSRGRYPWRKTAKLDVDTNTCELSSRYTSCQRLWKKQRYVCLNVFLLVFFFFFSSLCLPEHLTQVLDDLKQKHFHFIPPDTRVQIRRTTPWFCPRFHSAQVSLIACRLGNNNTVIISARQGPKFLRNLMVQTVRCIVHEYYSVSSGHNCCYV